MHRGKVSKSKLAAAEQILKAVSVENADRDMRDRYAAYLSSLYRSSMKAMDYATFKSEQETAHA